jgi:endonuclease-8
MPVAEIARTASAMRTALVGHTMLAFDAPKLIGPTPRAGRLIEDVEARGKHLQVTWDDGLVLDTHLRGSSEWHVYRHGAPWRRSWEQLRASIQTDDWVAVCFNAPTVETYRQPSRDRHPGYGRLGPDLSVAHADPAEAVELLLSYHDPDARLRDVLVDHHVIQGVGNVYRCEVLWALELSPWAHVGDLSEHDATHVVNTVTRFLRGHRNRTPTSAAPTGLAVYGRTGQPCMRCHASIEARPVGRSSRMLYWCPGCQTRLDRRDATPFEGRAMDPHPAAVRFLDELYRRGDDRD